MMFTYQGLVQIRTKTNVHTIHNLGSQQLFNMFAEFLVGSMSRLDDVKTMQLFYGTAAEILQSNVTQQSTIVSHKIPLKSQQIERVPEKSNIYGATFYTTIKPEFIVEKEAQHDDYSLVLFSGNTLLAVIEFTKSVYEDILRGGRADVKWTMTVSNSPVEQREVI